MERVRRRPRIRPALGALLGLLGLVFLLSLSGGYRYAPLEESLTVAGEPSREEAQRRDAILRRLRERVPADPYVVIDRVNNRIRLLSRKGALLEADCSTGSGKVLVDEAGGRRWEFVTPQGEFRVQSKLSDPVWKKPDWAFLEEGEPIPKNDADRFEYGALGEYALHFGDGYLIHGTLYERLLGRSVSHGCVRVGREPLRAIYRACGLGTRIFVH